MKENKFIHQNKHKWLNFEQGLKNKSGGIEDWSKYFIQLSDDLSYARTHYPNRSVRVYLNSLMQLVFHKVIRKRRFGKKAIKDFWTHDIPYVFYSIRKELLLSFLVFFTAVMIGVVSSHYDISFERAILGNGYVDMTIENIRKGDPMGVYKNDNSFMFFLHLTYGNFKVASLCFVLGVTAGLGTAFILIYNGIMLGCFQYLFFRYGSLDESLFTVWMHGSIEISAIVIAGGAGFTLARGILFPGTYTRMQAFRIYGVNAATAMIGLTPMLIVAGFIEVFITRFTEWEYWLRGAFILSCLIFVIYYVIILPLKKFKGVKQDPLNTISRPQVRQPFSIDLAEIKPNGRILEEVFALFRINFGSIFRLSALMALLFTASQMIFDTDLVGKELKEEGFFLIIALFRPHDYAWVQCIFFAASLSIFSLISDKWIRQKFGKPLLTDIVSKKFPLRFVLFFIGSLIIFPDTPVNVLFFMLIESFLLLVINVHAEEKSGIFDSLQSAGSVLFSSFLSYLGLVAVCLLSGLIVYVAANTLVVALLLELIGWNLWQDAGTLTYISLLIAVFINMLIVMCVIALLSISFKLFYFSARETRYAASLKNRIAAIP